MGIFSLCLNIISKTLFPGHYVAFGWKLPNTKISQVGDGPHPFTLTPRNIGCTLMASITLDKQVFHICHSSYCAFHLISAISHFYSPHRNFFFCSITLAELDCWNSLLLGCSDFLIHKLQKVDNSVAYLTLRAITLLHFYFVLFFGSPHGEYKLSLLCFPFFSGSSSFCFSELLTSYSQTAPLLVWWLHFDLSVFLEWILLANTHLHVVHLKPGTPVPIRLVQSLKVFKNFLTL